MSFVPERRAGASPLSVRHVAAAALLIVAACAPATPPATTPAPSADPRMSDRRVGLSSGLFTAGEAITGMKIVARAPSPPGFLGQTNSDLAFTGNYVIQGNYNGYQIWDISNPAAPSLRLSNYCPASQSDVSVYKNLLFVSAEGNTGRIDCGDQGVKETVSDARIKGVRIFDITDIEHPRNVANVQTCRGSHTHTVEIGRAHV